MKIIHALTLVKKSTDKYLKFKIRDHVGIS